MNAWSIRIDYANSRVTGDPQQLSSGTGVDAFPSFTADGRLLFATLTKSTDVWILPEDTNHAKSLGQAHRVTDTAGPHEFPSMSIDGKLLSYSSLRYGRRHTWIKNLESGNETELIGNGAGAVGGISHDGSFIYYLSGASLHGAKDKENGFIVPVGGGAEEQFCSGCFAPYDVSFDNRFVLYRTLDEIRAFDRQLHRDTFFMSRKKYQLFQHKFSPDGRWVAFEAVRQSRSRLCIAALRNRIEPAGEQEWIAVTPDEGWADKPRWSPDGNSLYFISNRDGFFCLWAQRLNVATKRPLGEPIAIAHYHAMRLSMGNVGTGGFFEIAVAKNKIALNLGELTGNLWTLSER